jgi:hypothetical protein
MEDIKVLAMYLPQYHRVKENDEWWGDGFTDWTAAKQASPIFPGHEQPKVPLDNNYYNLLDVNVLKWQADLMHKFNIYGMCIYHYWFKNGKKILEKPAEILLQHRDIDMPFCFSWASSSWVRSWSKLQDVNVWAPKYDEQVKGQSEILLEQDYGGEQEWIQHFMYLLPFFQDERYVKVSGRPVFVLMEPYLVPNLGDMLRLWTSLARQNGLPGIYVISNGTTCDVSEVDAIFLHAPAIRNREGDSKIGNVNIGKCHIYQYDLLWQEILDNCYARDIRTYYMGFTGFDDTPRRGEAADIAFGQSPKSFKDFFMKLLKKSKASENEFVFINAWNEWGEGMYIEPDNVHGFAYLEAVRSDICALAKEYRHIGDEVKKNILQDSRFVKDWYKCSSYYHLMHKWFLLKEKGVFLSKWLLEREYKEIAIYGLGEIGLHLVYELKQNGITICYSIDKKPRKNASFPVFENELDEYPQADALIVTPIVDFACIREKMLKKIQMPIISLCEIIYGLDKEL